MSAGRSLPFPPDFQLSADLPRLALDLPRVRITIPSAIPDSQPRLGENRRGNRRQILEEALRKANGN